MGLAKLLLVSHIFYNKISNLAHFLIVQLLLFKKILFTFVSY